MLPSKPASLPSLPTAAPASISTARAALDHSQLGANIPLGCPARVISSSHSPTRSEAQIESSASVSLRQARFRGTAVWLLLHSFCLPAATVTLFWLLVFFSLSPSLSSPISSKGIAEITQTLDIRFIWRQETDGSDCFRTFFTHPSLSALASAAEINLPTQLPRRKVDPSRGRSPCAKRYLHAFQPNSRRPTRPSTPKDAFWHSRRLNSFKRDDIQTPKQLDD